ncbi:hypothetical protein [Roseivirga misakiensis]|uniref:Cytochrome c domain-containing protein n=1 Tax=Roseivirga misakiensis TaxID=1563681 RepID=A0A1E5SKI4_9BACT|nr:hypothetical protein [Roseivirga misakiensis]OEJ99603.1 hypothetical protein BFP71_08500 [Roseivirga misakiensis]
MKTKVLFSLIAIALISFACGNDGGGDDQPDPCATPVVITVTNTINATAGQSDGSFTVTATGGSGGFEFSIDGGALQSSGTFTDLAAGTYTVTATGTSGCSNTLQVTVGENSALQVSFASDVLPILEMRCATAGCHVAGGNAPFAINGFSDAQPRAARFKARVAGRTMPPASATALTNQQIDIIVAWVDNGAQDN